MKSNLIVWFLILMILFLFLMSLASCESPDTFASSQRKQYEILQPLKDRKYVRAGRFIKYYIDKQKNTTIQNLLDFPEKYNFIANKSEYASLGFVNAPIWIKLKFRISKDEKRDFLLEVGNPQLQKVDFYEIKDSKILKHFSLGSHVALNQRTIEHENYIFPLEHKPGETKNYFLRIYTKEASNLPIIIWSSNSFFRANRLRTLSFGLFFGLFMAMALYNLFLFITVRDITYLYYVLYIFFLGCFFVNIYGFNILLFHNFVVPKYNYSIIMPGLSLLASSYALIFSRKFLLLRESLPGMARAMQVVLVMHIIGIIMLFFVKSPMPALLGNLLPLLGIILLVPSAIIRVYQKYKPAYYFLLAWSLLILGVTLFILQNFGFIPGNFITQYGQLFGAAAEAILLSFALGYRINDLKNIEEKTRQKSLEEKSNALEFQKRMASSFERFVPRDFLNYLERDSILNIKHGDVVQKNMTVLFTDIRGFTSLSEKLGSQTIFDLLNDYLGKMAPVIEKHNGIIDKFIGDAIMALFDKPEDAVQASIEMLDEMHHTISINGINNIELKTGFGMHFGELMLGTIGSPKRLETTVIGDTVNLAARIESVTKKYKTRIIVSDTVYRAVQNNPEIFIREIDSVYVKGKERPVVLFEVYNHDSTNERLAKKENHALFMEGLVYFRSGEFEQAAILFEKYKQKCPLDPIGTLYIDRIDTLKSDPNRIKTWSGIYDTWIN